jgi:hypothetical protein
LAFLGLFWLVSGLFYPHFGLLAALLSLVLLGIAGGCGYTLAHE